MGAGQLDAQREQHPGWEPMQGDTSMLNVQRLVTGLAVAPLGKRGKEVLLLGTATDLTAYDVLKNSDLFFRDLPDGVHALCCGRLAGRKQPVVFAGGACSISGLAGDGSDSFWAVTGAQVLALALVDGLDEGQPALVAGLDSGRIRIYAAAGEVCFACVFFFSFLFFVAAA